MLSPVVLRVVKVYLPFGATGIDKDITIWTGTHTGIVKTNGNRLGMYLLIYLIFNTNLSDFNSLVLHITLAQRLVKVEKDLL